MSKTGTLSINTENIFPIIKKFLYSDHDIFLRELVSNAVDAAQKIQQLGSMGEFKGEVGDLKVTVAIDETAKTITISDNGIGMTADEIEKYINQIAFSGATEFVEKYKDKGDQSQIIGHFGLGFYSAYMVAGKVEIQTLSYKDGSKPARWECDGSTTFEISEGTRETRGTDIILYINEDSVDFLQKPKVQEILNKYDKFLPIEVEFDGKVINNTTPVWTKSPKDLKDEDYLAFYKELYPYEPDPLFWIHLNVDYPFNLTGVLFFPQIDKNKFEVQKNKISLYSRQVFITDEVKDVVPEFLQLLHGVIDSPDIPLNVSRSYLQADSSVKKINTYISKKVADKLAEIYKKDRKEYEEKWDSIGVFVKYGMLTDEKFYDKAEKFCLLKNSNEEFYSFEEYQEKFKASQTDKNDSFVMLYTSDKDTQHSFIESATKQNYDVIEFDTMIDSHFTGLLERKLEKTQLKRVDSDTVDKLIEKDTKMESVLSEKESEKVKELFETAVNDKMKTVLVEPLAPEDHPVTITLPEFSRRMKEMQMSGGMAMMGDMPLQYNVTINANSPIIQRILRAKGDNRTKISKQAYDLALLSQNLLTGKELADFIQRSENLLAD